MPTSNSVSTRTRVVGQPELPSRLPLMPNLKLQLRCHHQMLVKHQQVAERVDQLSNKLEIRQEKAVLMRTSP